MRKKELAKIIIERLKEEYPDADCTLDYNDAWKLLISVRLAAQCTDARVNVVVPHLYEKFPTIDALANADVSEIEEIVRPCGLGRSKARDISLCMRMLRDEFDSKVPDDFNQLLKLPGVGRKSANLIMGDVFGKPAIVSNNGGLPEIVDDGKTGFICEPNNPDSLCACLEKMNNLTEDEYLAMSKAALEKARENCDCEKYYEKLMNCYKDLIKAKGGKKI